MVSLEGLLQGRNFRGDMDHVFLLAIGLQDKMIILIISHLHGLEGVPVIGMG